MPTIAEKQAEAKAALTQARARYFTLNEALNVFEANKRNFSKSDANIEPKDGYEKAFDAECDKIRIIREMMQEESARQDRALKEIWEV